LSAATFPLRRLSRRRSAPAQEHAAPPPPRRVLISARQAPDAGQASIERIDWRCGTLELQLRLEDGSRGVAMLLDDDVNSLELEPGATVFALNAPGS
jgi:hypothetical protein